MWNYQHLEVYETILRVGSFQAAARILHITQSAVSQRLRALEDQVGVRLLIREQPLRPTSYGEKLLQLVRQVKSLESEFELGQSDYQLREFKTLILGINGDSLATWFFPAIAESLKKQSFLIQTIIENEDLTFSRLKKGEVFGCISSRSKALAGCDVEKLGSITYRLACIPEFQLKHFSKGLTPESLSSAPAIIYDDYDFIHAMFLEQKLKLRNIKFPYHLIANSDAFLNSILYGIAYGMAPVIQSKTYFESGQLVDLAPGKFWKQDLYWHHQRGLDKNLRRFSDELLRKGKMLLTRRQAQVIADLKLHD